MSAIELDVYLGERRAGVIKANQNRFEFEYDADWTADPDAYPLSYSMPLEDQRHTGSIVGNFLWGLLPDNNDILKAWGARFGVSPRNPVALLAHVGEDCAGALRFLPPGAEPKAAGEISWLTDDQLYERIDDLVSSGMDGRILVEEGHFSLAGAQRKTALRFDALRQRWGVPKGLEPTDSILKPSIPDFEHQVWNEDYCLHLARDLGLPAAASRVIKVGPHDVLVVERFDRLEKDGKMIRIHQEDMCQALGVHPDGKYQKDRGPNPVDIIRLLDNSSAPQDDHETFVRALLFNILIGGTDGHAKNYALMWASGPSMRLAPLYDLNSIWPYTRPYGQKYDRQKLKTAMSLGNQYKFSHLVRKDIDTFCRKAKLPANTVHDWMTELAELTHVMSDKVTAASIKNGAPAAYVNNLAQAIRAEAERWM